MLTDTDKEFLYLTAVVTVVLTSLMVIWSSRLALYLLISSGELYMEYGWRIGYCL
ncbi:hypothetical protein V6N13_021739 [Hibiscus sabdariffa]